MRASTGRALGAVSILLVLASVVWTLPRGVQATSHENDDTVYVSLSHRDHAEAILRQHLDGDEARGLRVVVDDRVGDGDGVVNTTEVKDAQEGLAAVSFNTPMEVLRLDGRPPLIINRILLLDGAEGPVDDGGPVEVTDWRNLAWTRGTDDAVRLIVAMPFDGSLRVSVPAGWSIQDHPTPAMVGDGAVQVDAARGDLLGFDVATTAPSWGSRDEVVPVDPMVTLGVGFMAVAAGLLIRAWRG